MVRIKYLHLHTPQHCSKRISGKMGEAGGEQKAVERAFLDNVEPRKDHSEVLG